MKKIPPVCERKEIKVNLGQDKVTDLQEIRNKRNMKEMKNLEKQSVEPV